MIRKKTFDVSAGGVNVYHLASQLSGLSVKLCDVVGCDLRRQLNHDTSVLDDNVNIFTFDPPFLNAV